MVKYFLRGLVIVLGLNISPTHAGWTDWYNSATSTVSKAASSVGFNKCNTNFNRLTCTNARVFAQAINPQNGCTQNIKNCTAAFCTNNCTANGCKNPTVKKMCIERCNPDVSGLGMLSVGNLSNTEPNVMDFVDSAKEVQNGSALATTQNFQQNFEACLATGQTDPNTGNASAGSPMPIKAQKQNVSGINYYTVNGVNLNTLATQLLTNNQTISDAPRPSATQATLSATFNQQYLNWFVRQLPGIITKLKLTVPNGVDPVMFINTNMIQLSGDNDFVSAALNVNFEYQIVSIYYSALLNLMKQLAASNGQTLDPSNATTFNTLIQVASAKIAPFLTYIAKASADATLIGAYKKTMAPPPAQPTNDPNDPFGGFGGGGFDPSSGSAAPVSQNQYQPQTQYPTY